MNNWMRRYLEQEQGTVETEFDRDMVDALEDDGLVGVIESDMGYGDSWHITDAGRAALAAPEPPSPVVCGKCGKPLRACPHCGEEWRETPSPAAIVPVYAAPEPRKLSPDQEAVLDNILADAKAKGWPGADRPLVVEVGGAPEPPACPNCDAGHVMRLDNGNLYCPFCGWQTLNANPLSPALVNDGGPEYPVAEAWRGYAEAAEERAAEAARKLSVMGAEMERQQIALDAALEVEQALQRNLAAEREAHRALVAALAAARDVLDAARALIASARETADHAGWEAGNRSWADIASAMARWEAVSANQEAE